MRRIVTLFLITILCVITCSSQNILTRTKKDSTVLITSEELKYTNLIFVEHEKLLKENDLLSKQIKNLDFKANYYEAIDSLKTKQLNAYKELNAIQTEELNKVIKDKNKDITKWKIGCFTISIAFLLFLLK